MRPRPRRSRRWRGTCREYLAKLDLDAPAAPSRSHGRLSFRLLAAARPAGASANRRNCCRGLGFIVKEVPEGHLCCGSAGTYNILQPEIAERLRARKVGQYREQTGRCDCRRQHRLHHADRVGHRDPGGASGRIDRLGDRRAGAGGIARARRHHARERSVGGRTDRENDHGARTAKKRKRAKRKAKKATRRQALSSRKKKARAGPQERPVRRRQGEAGQKGEADKGRQEGRIAAQAPRPAAGPR